MWTEKPKKIKEWLKEHREEREFIWRMLVNRTDLFREAAKFDKESFLFRVAARIDHYNAMEQLYRNLLRKRHLPVEDGGRGQIIPFTPNKRHSVNLADGVNETFAKAWFKAN